MKQIKKRHYKKEFEIFIQLVCKTLYSSKHSKIRVTSQSMNSFKISNNELLGSLQISNNIKIKNDESVCGSNYLSMKIKTKYNNKLNRSICDGK